MCGAELAFRVIDTGEITLLSQDTTSGVIAVMGNIITFTSKQIASGHHYNVSIASYNIAGSHESHFMLRK